jgi:putative endonuclease
MQKAYSVYILECSDGSYNTGVTNDIQRRLKEHHIGINTECYTYKRRPLELVFQEVFADVNQAIKAEKTLKGWGRKKKQTLINKGWEAIKNNE